MATRRQLLTAGVTGALLIPAGVAVADDGKRRGSSKRKPIHHKKKKHYPGEKKDRRQSTGHRLVTRITPTGERIMGVAVDTEVELLAVSDLRRVVSVSWTAPGQEPTSLSVQSAFTASSPGDEEVGNGRYLIVEFAGLDEELPQPYELIRGNEDPTPFREFGADGEVITVDRVQATNTPSHLDETLRITFELTGSVLTADDDAVEPQTFEVPARRSNFLEQALGEFEEGEMKGKGSGNVLNYRLRRAKGVGKAPLVVFLHGSGQVGQDNDAHMLSSLGAVGVLDYEDCWVLAPQLPSVFDPHDEFDPDTREGGGIHWQSDNRQQLVIDFVRKLIRRNPGIEASRVYVQGLSRGGEGALMMALKAPDLFAAMGSFSGREAGTIEWMDGQATSSMLEPGLETRMWFFHATQDPVAPVEGTRRNVELLQELGHSSLRYTEIDYAREFDAGYANSSAHNSWDVGYNSSAFWEWLLGQRKG